MSELETFIESSALPIQLKEYFIGSKNIQKVISEEILDEIEDLYVYYDSLYKFDTSEFGVSVIDSLMRCKDFNMYYFYLKKILENQLVIESKDENRYIKINKVYLDDSFKKTASEIINLMASGFDDNLNRINFYLGKLEIINELIEDEYYSEIYTKVTEFREKYYLK